MEKLDLGSGPAEEPCAAVGSKRYDYETMGRLECRAWIVALQRKYGDPPEGCWLRTTSNPHEFGAYYTVTCHYDPNQKRHLDYALQAEHGLELWEDANMRAPVHYDEDGNVTLVLTDPEHWDKLKHPELVQALRVSDEPVPRIG